MAVPVRVLAQKRRKMRAYSMTKITSIDFKKCQKKYDLDFEFKKILNIWVRGTNHLAACNIKWKVKEKTLFVDLISGYGGRELPTQLLQITIRYL